MNCSLNEKQRKAHHSQSATHSKHIPLSVYISIVPGDLFSMITNHNSAWHKSAWCVWMDGGSAFT
ncbi:hypothetical protein T10_2074 [Trichinella papuae]|uniref:Uncharacterized protein n=1 Tax=Trichinella papuae TaxID=268474 RepID=A0A0V1MC52_9BILA|nr:hypothetical protein T10_2074 [Trichinella papuae]